MIELIVAFRNSFEKGCKNVRLYFQVSLCVLVSYLNFRTMGPVVTKIGYRWPSNVLSSLIFISKNKMADLRS